MTPPPTGVLLVNTGSPQAPTAQALRPYLREFLSDPMVVDLPRWLWLPVLHGIILRTRPPRSAQAYQRVWTDEGSPLLAISCRQADALDQRLGPGVVVRTAMRYGRPSLADGFAELTAAGCRQVLLVPMFPQQAAATYGSVVVGARAACPEGVRLDVVPPWYDHPAYLDALAAGIADEHRGEHLLLSFHGIPARVARAGDPYPEHCAATARGVIQRLGLADDAWTRCFQSRFGPEPWLKPYTDKLVLARAPAGEDLLVACPGFLADCLETLDEIGIELAREYAEAGGGRLRLVPCVNDAPALIEALASLVGEHLPTPVS